MVYNDGGYNTYPTTITNALGQAANIAYNYTFGVPTSETDANGATTLYGSEFQIKSTRLLA